MEDWLLTASRPEHRLTPENTRMANLYKKPVVRTDPQTGKRVKTKSKKWWGRFRDAACQGP
jgi:hypothetical protein